MATIRPNELPAADSVADSVALVVDTGSAVQKATPSQVVDAAIPLASEAEAVAGADNAKRMTPLRVKQAMDANMATTDALASPEPGKGADQVAGASRVLRVDDRGAKGDGEANDTAAISATFATANDGDIIEFRKGGRYRITSVDIAGGTNGKQVTLRGYGATIIQTAKQRGLHWMGTWGEIYSVASITQDTIEVDGFNYTVDVLNCSDTITDIAADDIVKVYSEDDIPQTVFSGRRLGEFATVLKVEDDKIYLNGRLFETGYATDIRVTRMDRKRPIIEGLTFEIDPSLDTSKGSGGGWDAPLHIAFAFMPILRDLWINRTVSNGIVLVSCLGYRADNSACVNLPDQDDAADERYGYGVVDANCAFGTVSNGLFINCRHGFSTNTYGQPSTEPWAYGRSFFGKVKDSDAIGGASAGFDTHDEAWGFEFNNCTHFDSVNRDSEDSASIRAGFQMRGGAWRLVNCRTNIGVVGFASNSRVGSGDDLTSQDCWIINSEARNTPQRALRLFRANVNIVGGHFSDSPSNESSELASFFNARINIHGGEWRLRNAASAAQVIGLYGDTRLDIGGGPRFDVSYLNLNEDEKLVNYSQRIVRSNDADDNVVTINDIDIYAGSKPMADVVARHGSDSTTIATVGDVRIEADATGILCADDATRNPGLFALFGGFDAASASATNVVQRTEGSVSSTSRTKYVSASGSGDLTNPTRWIADDYMLDYSPSSGTTTISNLADGYVAGQKLTIRHRGSSNTLRIPHGGNISLVGSSDKDLTAGQMHTLTWTGSAWVG